MVVPLKLVLFLSFALSAAAQQLETDYIHDPGETTREFILDQNEEMKKFLKEEMEKMFATMSKTFGAQQLKVTGKLQKVSRSISYLTTALFPAQNLTEVEEVNAEGGTIQFTGGLNPYLRTKIWILRSKGGDSSRVMRFVLQENGLGEEAHLSIWGSGSPAWDYPMWIGSQGDWPKERNSAGHVILVTLLISPGGAETPSFKLKFNTPRTLDGHAFSSEVLDLEGSREVSFPPNNTHNYPPWSSFVAVVAPPRGGFFRLTLKYFDIPGTPNPSLRCDNNEFFVWFLEESPTEEPFTRLPPSVVRPCGKVGAISEPLGNSTVAIIQFLSGNGPVGRGFRVEAN